MRVHIFNNDWHVRKMRAASGSRRYTVYDVPAGYKTYRTLLKAVQAAKKIGPGAEIWLQVETKKDKNGSYSSMYDFLAIVL